MKDTKEKILKTSLTLFAEKGYHAASVRNTTSKLGFRESALYNHFSSKESILEALCEKYKSGRINKVILTDDLLDELSRPEKFLEIFAKRLFEFWSDEEEKLFFQFVLKEIEINLNQLTISINSYLDELRSIWWMIFDEMKKLKIIKNIDPQIITDEYISRLFLLRIEFTIKHISKDELFKKIDDHINFIWNAIKPD